MKSIFFPAIPRCFKVNTILLLIIFICNSWNNCSAQSILGKWNQLKIKTYYTPEGAKANGNQSESEINMSTIGKAEFVFYSNHTYRQETSTGDSKVRSIQGTWTLSGDQLTMQLLAQQDDPKDNPKKGTPPEKVTVSFHDNIMDWISNNLNNNLISKVVLTFAKNS